MSKQNEEIGMKTVQQTQVLATANINDYTCVYNFAT